MQESYSLGFSFGLFHVVEDGYHLGLESSEGSRKSGIQDGALIEKATDAGRGAEAQLELWSGTSAHDLLRI